MSGYAEEFTLTSGWTFAGWGLCLEVLRRLFQNSLPMVANLDLVALATGKECPHTLGLVRPIAGPPRVSAIPKEAETRLRSQTSL